MAPLTAACMIFVAASYFLNPAINAAYASTLRAGFGINFKNAGRIQPALDRRYLTLDLQLPGYSPRFQATDFIVSCKTTADINTVGHQAANSVCYDFK